MRTPLVLALLAAPALAQANAIPGADVQIFDVFGPTLYGHRGPAFPNGETGMNFGHSMCNSGTANLPWTGGTFGGPMTDTFPKIASLLVRESNGRMVQISGRSFAKYSRTAFNFASGPCAPCLAGPSQTWRTGCSDTYSSGFSSLSSLGPTEEVDPWLGTINLVGSYFDRGVPDVGAPANSDGVQSTVGSNGDPLQSRMAVRDQDLLVPGTFYGEMHLVMIGEPGQNRFNNQASRQMSFTSTGTGFSPSALGATVQGPVLTRWTGAQNAIGQNGQDDGRFMVAWTVSGPVNGLWHYEYAVHNLDSSSAGATFRLPVCGLAQIVNFGFHDIDADPLNDWTMVRTSGELSFQAGANNAIEWNTLYNFWFDSDAAPLVANVAIDRARLGPGALFTQINGVQVPGDVGNQRLGDGCGSPVPELFANVPPAIPEPNYALFVQTQPFTATLLIISLGSDNVSLGSGCTQQVDLALATTGLFGFTDQFGSTGWSLPIPPGIVAGDVYVQAAALVTGGPVLGSAALTNGLHLRVGLSGCP